MTLKKRSKKEKERRVKLYNLVDFENDIDSEDSIVLEEEDLSKNTILHYFSDIKKHRNVDNNGIDRNLSPYFFCVDRYVDLGKIDFYLLDRNENWKKDVRWYNIELKDFDICRYTDGNKAIKLCKLLSESKGSKIWKQHFSMDSLYLEYRLIYNTEEDLFKFELHYVKNKPQSMQIYKDGKAHPCGNIPLSHIHVQGEYARNEWELDGFWG